MMGTDAHRYIGIKAHLPGWGGAGRALFRTSSITVRGMTGWQRGGVPAQFSCSGSAVVWCGGGCRRLRGAVSVLGMRLDTTRWAVALGGGPGAPLRGGALDGTQFTISTSRRSWPYARGQWRVSARGKFLRRGLNGASIKRTTSSDQQLFVQKVLAPLVCRSGKQALLRCLFAPFSPNCASRRIAFPLQPAMS